MQSILSIDIGSTRTHVAAINININNNATANTNAPILSSIDRIDFNNSDFDTLFTPSIKKIVSSNPSIRRAVITSCVKKLSANAKNLCVSEKRFDIVKIVTAHPNLPMPISINYADSQKLGTDRICNAVACAALFPGEDCVIVDLGTAATVDLLRGGRVFEGGAILPGVSMQLNALHLGTDALPLVQPPDRITPLGKSTEECMAAGVLYGLAGAIDNLIAEYLNICGNGGARIIATGGGWGGVSPFVRHEAEFVPDLTLMGAAACCDGVTIFEKN